MTILRHCVMQNIPRRYFRRTAEIPPNWLPVGNVDWCEAALGRKFTPDYYPEFLSPWLHRKVWPADKWPHGHRIFVKPADRYKRFTGFVTNGTWKGKKRAPLLCSEVVSFTNEWRYYIANGTVLAAHWYSGDEEAMPPAPPLPIDWPPHYCAAVDFGHLPDGRLALVEAQHPFACGWYGDTADGATYLSWLSHGWRSIQRLE